MAHKTLINGTSYDIKSGRTLIGGTGYDIKKGRTLIDGTGYDITFATPISELPVGSSVYANVDGERTEFIIVHQGKPDITQNDQHYLELYDDTCVGTWVMMKQIYYVAAGISGEKLNSGLSNIFLKKLDVSIRAMIGTANIPTDSNEGNVYTEKCKIFNLGAFEVGFYKQSGTNYVWMPNDGAKLDYFIKGNTTSNAKKRRIAYWGNTARQWTLRAVRSTGYYNKVWEVTQDGEGNNGSSTSSDFNFFRPTWIFPEAAGASVDDSFNIIPA